MVWELPSSYPALRLNEIIVSPKIRILSSGTSPFVKLPYKLHCFFFAAGYFGGDCSLAADTVPVLSNFRRECTCDVRQFRCSRVFVIATDIYNSASQTCMVKAVDHSISLRGSAFLPSDEVNIVFLTSSQYVNHTRVSFSQKSYKCLRMHEVQGCGILLQM